MEIQFSERELNEIRAFLQEQRNDGNTLVAFLDDAPLHVYDLNCFSDPYKTQEFCYENTTDVDHYRIETTDHLLNVVEAQIQDLNNFYNLNKNIMKQENFDYLKEQVKFSGFGEGLEKALKDRMEFGASEFQLQHEQKFGKDETTTLLNFRYSPEQERYYFNSYDISLKKGESDPIRQHFEIRKENSYTFKEAYNLLAGRAVNKDLMNRQGEFYNSWVKLNFKETDDKGNFKKEYFTENYGYKLDEALAKHPIKELSNEEDKARLIGSLYKGNRQQVTFVKDGQESKAYVEANPQYKTVNVYDANMKRLNNSQKQSESEGRSEKQAAKAKQTTGDEEGGPRKNQKNDRKKKQGITG